MIKAFSVLAMCAALTSCSPSRTAGQPSPSAVPTAPSTSTPAPPGVWIQPGVPQGFVASVFDPLGKVIGTMQVDSAANANIRLVLDPPTDAILTSQTVYALVAPFPTPADGVTWADLQAYWQGRSNSLPGFDTPPKIIIPDDDSLATFTTMLGQPGSAVLPIDVSSSLNGLVLLTYSHRPAISIVAFDQLQPLWKVLSIDGNSPLDKKLDLNTYPLTITAGMVVDAALSDKIASLLPPDRHTINRDPAHIIVVIMTGTTALTRSTAYMMDLKGVDYPAQNILPFFADKDILHISNEVSFTPKCPPPDPNGDEKFCSNPKYLDLLTGIGADVIELTGNHNNDYGINPTNYSLDMYDTSNLPYYGGGRNLADAMAPRILSAPDGTRVAFIGCNSAGPFKAFATADSPGAAPCNDWAWMKNTIADLKANRMADFVIATVQYHESQSYSPEPKQKIDFQALADAGADVVSGSQAHVPQGFAVSPTSFIHYGVGNLFFDQMDSIQNRQMFADKYILYSGRLISVVLFTGIMEDYSQPRPMTPQERQDFLKLIFETGG